MRKSAALLAGLLLVLLALASCGPPKHNVEQAIEEARQAGLALEKNQATDQETFTYRNLLRGAELAMERGDMESALKQANIAKHEAARVVKERHVREKEVRADIIAARKLLNKITNPSLLDSRTPYFLAVKHYLERDYMKAGEYIQQAKRSLKNESQTDFEKHLMVDKLPSSYKETVRLSIIQDGVPIYAKATKDCRLSRMIGRVKLQSEVKFIESRWYTDLKRCIKIQTLPKIGERKSVLDEGKPFTPIVGWIQGRFVDIQKRQNVKARR